MPDTDPRPTPAPNGPPKPNRSESYTELVTVRRFAAGALLPHGIGKVPAFRHERGGALHFYLKAMGGAWPTERGEIVDAEGRVYTVTRVTLNPPAGWHCAEVVAR